MTPGLSFQKSKEKQVGEGVKAISSGSVGLSWKTGLLEDAYTVSDGRGLWKAAQVFVS